MIKRFIQVTPGLFRGSAPSVRDVIELHKSFGIKKIVSLDASAGQRIDRICKLLNINHIIIPITGTHIYPLAELLSYDLHDLLINGGPTYVHCIEGKDRTGMVIAMFKCKYMGWSCEDAIKEAKKIGFGVGLNDKVTKMYKKIICMSCLNKHNHANIEHIDNNSADIIENMRDDQVEHDVNMPSFAPYVEYTRQYPHQQTYDYKYDMYPTRENHNEKVKLIENEDEDDIPLVGLYDNDAGIHGAGPVENGGGFVNTI